MQVTYITFFFVQHTGTLGTVYEMLLYISLSMGIFYSSELDQGPCQHAVTCQNLNGYCILTYLGQYRTFFSVWYLKVSKSQKQFFLETPLPKKRTFRFLGNGVSRKIAFEIYWPLVRTWINHAVNMFFYVFCRKC